MENPYDGFFIPMNDLFWVLQRRIKRTRSTQHARDNMNYTDLALNEAHHESCSNCPYLVPCCRPPCSSLCYYIHNSSCIMRSLEPQMCILVPTFWYLRTAEHLHTVCANHTYVHCRSIYVRILGTTWYFFADRYRMVQA